MRQLQANNKGGRTLLCLQGLVRNLVLKDVKHETFDVKRDSGELDRE